MHWSLAKLFLSICLGAAAVVGFATAQEARAQDCESLSGPARTDCYIGRNRIFGEQSGIAASSSRLRTSAERLRAVTGGSYDPTRPKVHKASKTRSKHKVHRD
jgi:hypothetical protein